MKKILCLAFVLFASIGVFAQEKTIQQAEFETISRSSSQLLSGKPLRIIRTVQSTVEVIPQTNPSDNSTKTLPSSNISIKSTTEFLPSVGFHTVYEFNSSSKNTKKETIRIGDKTYTREGTEEWIELAAAQVATKSKSTARKIDNQIEYKLIGSDKLDNQNTNVYAKIEKSKLINSIDNQESFASTTTKYWYGEDGRLLKRERKREIRHGRMISKFNSTIVFEVAPNIKIEAPKLNLIK
jgi:hypothetical protein